MKSLKEYASLVEERLPRLIPEGQGSVPASGGMPALQAESMRYSLLAGGKRLRPSLLLAAVDMLGGDLEEAMVPACALEMIHTYSLIHDDLPGMDNDTLRRGRPTNHVVFGEGQAILAGDGLLNLAYELMLQNAMAYPEHAARHIQAMNGIAACAGSRGMVAGQCLDLMWEQRKGVPGADPQRLLYYIQENKTARLLIAPLCAAAALTGHAPEDAVTAALTGYGLHFGLLFQAVDDLLDVVGDAQALGKSTGKDAEEGKLTCVTLWGIDKTRQWAERQTEQAIECLAPLGEKADFFRALVREMTHRVR